MTKLTSFSLVIASALLLSACTVTKNPTGTPNQAGENQPTTTPTEQSQSTSLRELLANGQNQKCTFAMSETDKDDNKTDTNGTLYISDKKMAEEVEILSRANEAKNVSMRIVSDGIYMYTWDYPSKGQPGMKYKIIEPTGTEDNKTQNQNVDLDKKVDMQCSPWAVDESKFTVPTDVKFTDLTELMKNIPTIPAIPTGK